MRDFKQAYVSNTLDYFKPNLMKKWEFEEYSDPTKPAFFFGIYSNEDLEAFENHKSYKILYFGGNDFRERQIELVRNTKNVVCVGYGGDWLEKGTRFYGLPYDSSMVLTRSFEEFKPTILGDKIYVYKGRLGTRPEYFKWEEIVMPIIEEFGEDRVIYADNIDLIDLRDNYYNKSFVYLKPNPRGGSTAMYELGLMGRMTITNDHSRFPNAIGYNSVDDIISIIKGEEYKIGKINYDVSNAVRKLIDHGDEWLSICNYDWKKLNNR